MNVALALVALAVSLVGAITGFQWIASKVRRNRVRREHQKALTAVATDYSYKNFEAAARISDNGLSWYVRRSAIIVVQTDWKGTVETVHHRDGVVPGSFENLTEPSSIAIDPVPTDHPSADKFHLRFLEGLTAGDERPYVYISKFLKVAPLRSSDEFAVTFMGRNCDHLVLRIVFDGFAPAELKYRIMDRMLVKEIHCEVLSPDPVSYEVRKEIPFPNTNLLYGFFWRYNRTT
jgi:hypothetical protein